MGRKNATTDTEIFDTFCKQLCKSCSVMRYLGYSVKETGFPDTKSTNFSWSKNGISRAQMTEQNCPLCRQLPSFAPGIDMIETVRLMLVSDTVGTGPLRGFYDGLQIDIDSYDSSVTATCRLGLLDSPFESVAPLAHFNPCSVDFGQVQSWIESCETDHSDQCGILELLPIPGFKVMDCTTGIVASIPEISTKYAALSYVWGKPQSDEAAFPRTVQDAMTAAMAFGVHYLWVDRYCIDQTDEDIKQQQIKMMNTIYTQAYFTIVAPEGDAYQGLPGVNGLGRYTPTVLSLGNVSMRLVKDPMTELRLGNWAWTKRAWTYQEGCVSRRKMFFTNAGVLFWCGPMYRLEGLQYLSSCSDTKNDYVPQDLRNAVPHVRTTPDLADESSRKIIAHYSEREMTYEHDALNACLGVFNAFNITHCWGVPIIPHPSTKSPDMMLFWRTQKAGPERCGFPTWSWTRWNAPVDFVRMSARSSIKAIEVQLQDMGWCNILQEWPYRGNLGRIGCGKKLRITGYTVEFQYSPIDYPNHFFVSTSRGREYQFYIRFDSKDDSMRKCLAETTMFELDQLREVKGMPRNGKSYYFPSGRYLVLKKQGEEYRRIGLAHPIVLPAKNEKSLSSDSTVGEEQQSCTDDLIELEKRRLQTIYLV